MCLGVKTRTDLVPTPYIRLDLLTIVTQDVTIGQIV